MPRIKSGKTSGSAVKADFNLQSGTDSAIGATSSQPPLGFPIPPPPPIHSFSTASPSFQHYAYDSYSASPPYRVSASAGTPAPTPAYRSTSIPPTNSTGTASAPVGSQFSGYRPLSTQQPFYSPALATTYPRQTPLSTASSHLLSPDPTGYKPRLASRSGRRKADAYVAHDPFRPGSSSQAVGKFPAILSDTTFDDIPTAGSPRALTPSASTPFGTGNSYDLSNPHQVSGPSRAYQTQNTASSQYATPLSQPTGSYQYPYFETQLDAVTTAAAQQTPFTEKRPLAPLRYEDRPRLPGPSYVHPAHSSYLPVPGQAGLTSSQDVYGPFPHIHYPNLPEPHSSPSGKPLVLYPYSPPRLEQSYEHPNVLLRQGQVSPYEANDFIPEYVNQANNPPSVWLQIGRFIRLPYDLMRGRRSLADQFRLVCTDRVKEKIEEPDTAANRNIFVTLLKTFYWHLLLRLPSLYFGRVTRIFEEADLTLPEIKRMALETAVQGQCDVHAMENSTLSPQYERLKVTWQSFIDDAMKEWETFNIISVLLLSAILSILNNASANDPVLQYCALSSLICALLSLLFGCTYIIRFGSMRKTYKAAEWALESMKTKTFIFWNIWILLAMPVVWLTWSIFLFLLCIMLFVWRAGTPRPEPFLAPSNKDLLAVRLVLTFLLVFGINYGILILATFSQYGEAMDKAWKRRVDGWLEEQAALPPAPAPPPFPPAPFSYTPVSYPAPGPRQGQFAPPYITPPPATSPQPPPEPNFDGAYHPIPPAYMDVGCGYTSDQKTLAPNAFSTRNTMLKKSAHLKPDDTTTNLTHKSPTANSETTSPHEVPSVTVRLVAPKDSLPPIRVPPLDPKNSEDLSPRVHEGNQNQYSPHVRFRSPLTSAVESPEFNPEDLYLYVESTDQKIGSGK